jgi:hypothetical protein
MVAMVLASIGCGYSTRRPFPSDYASIHVQIFHNRGFRRDLEFRLTEALVKRIQLETDYKVVQRDRADTILTGELAPARQAAFARDFETTLPREIQLTMTAAFSWKDAGSGRVLSQGEQHLVTQATDYIPPVGETFFQGSQEAIEDLARRIVSQLMDPEW